MQQICTSGRTRLDGGSEVGTGDHSSLVPGPVLGVGTERGDKEGSRWTWQLRDGGVGGERD